MMESETLPVVEVEEPQDATSLLAKLVAIMANVDNIPKSGWNEAQKYHFVTEADVTNYLRPALASSGILPVVSLLDTKERETTTASGKQILLTHAVISFTLYDVETGQNLKIYMSGSGTDMGDKGIYKAVTGAVKYALMKTFMVAGSDDPETEGIQQRAIREERARMRRHTQAVLDFVDNVNAIKDGIATNNLGRAAEAWFELTKETMRDLWVAPTKGGVFTTEERSIMKSAAFKEAVYGPEVGDPVPQPEGDEVREDEE